jgi:hypothetical protein
MPYSNISDMRTACIKTILCLALEVEFADSLQVSTFVEPALFLANP